MQIDFARASEVSYTRSQSSSSYADKVKMSYSFDSANKLGLSYKQAKDTSGAADDKTSNLKFSYRFKTEEAYSFTGSYAIEDDTYNYEGQNLGLSASLPIYKINWSKTSQLTTKLNLGFNVGDHRYSKISNESFSQRSFSVGFDQDLPNNFSMGVDYSVNSYLATGTLTTKALNNVSISNTDISSYASTLGLNSSSIFIEYSGDEFSLGASYAVDSDYIGSGKSNTTEIYSEIIFQKDFSLSLSFAKGRTEGSTSTTDTTSVGLGYNF